MLAPFRSLVVAAVIFFGVGEFAGGWYLGAPPYTPIFVYKKTTTAVQTRRVRAAEGFAFKLTGRLRGGTVLVEGTYERPASYQNPGLRPLAERPVFRKEYAAGETVELSESLRYGEGTYRVRLNFEAATGTLRLSCPLALFKGVPGASRRLTCALL